MQAERARLRCGRGMLVAAPSRDVSEITRGSATLRAEP
jgi:hypothetical protein